MELSRDTVKRRIERYLATLDQKLRVSKSIRDKAQYGTVYIIDNNNEIIKSNTSLAELLVEYKLLLEDENYE